MARTSSKAKKISSKQKVSKTTYNTQTNESKDPFSVNVLGYNGEELVDMMNRRIEDSKRIWSGKHYNLDSVSKDNLKYYLGEQATSDDMDEEDRQLDNRIFSAVQTVTTYTTSRITEPEVYPSSNSIESQKFAEDWEKALYIKAEMEQLEEKMGYALEDAIIQRRGYLKPRYDPVTQNFCCIDYIPCESVIVDHKAKIYEEPRHVRFILEYSPEDLMIMFPDAEDVIKQAFKLPDNASRAQLEKVYECYENWMFVKTEDNQSDLIIFWQYNNVAFGAIQDPNWRYGKDNFLPHHMIPLVGLNVLSDGRSWIDKTSYVEQAKYSQKTIDTRSRQINENAGLGSVGMPVVDSAALADDQAQDLVFEPDLVIELDVDKAAGDSVQDVFTTWKADPLSSDVYKNRDDAIGAVENAFGASAIQQGNQTDNQTLGQDELLKDSGQGRQQKTIKAIDKATNRIYMFMSQFMLVYGSEEELFESVGEDSEYDAIIISSSDLDAKCKIRVKGGTSMPVDNNSRRATASVASQQAMIDPLTFWEIMDKPNARKYAKRVADWTKDPASFMADVNEEIFDRDAYSDIWMLKHGKQPPYRDDLTKNYFDYLNQYVLSGDLENPKIAPTIASTISEFINIQLARGQKMLGMAETQLPTPQDIDSHNQQVDEANAQNAAASKGIVTPEPPQPVAEGPTPQSKPMASSSSAQSVNQVK